MFTFHIFYSPGSHRTDALGQWSPTFLALGTSFMEDDFSTDRVGVVWVWFKHITLIVHYVSIIITSAPPQIIRHQILETGTLL